MLKLFFIIFILLIYSCSPKSNKDKINTSKTTNEIKTKIEKNDFEIITFDKETKSIYRKDKPKTVNKVVKFNNLFKKLKESILTIHFYVNFENFSSIPEIYREKMGENNTFKILGINIGENYILTELNILKEASVIYINDNNNGIIYLNIVGYDENFNIAILKSTKKINKKEINILKTKNKEFLPGDLMFSLFSISNNEFSFKKHFINFLHYSEFHEVVDAIYSNSISYIANSGGLVFSSNGDFLGVISLYDSYYENSAYIVTNEIIKKILPKLKDGYKIKQNAWLGLYLEEKNNHVFVTNIVNDSPAKDSDIKIGDQIIKINKNTIKSKNEIKRIISFSNPGNILNIELIRNNTPIKSSIKLIDKPLKYLYKQTNKQENINVNKIGIKLKKEADNIVVSEVEEGSLSFIYGIKIGDIILDVSGNKIKTIQEYNNCIHTLKNLRIKLLRGKEVKYIAFKKS